MVVWMRAMQKALVGVVLALAAVTAACGGGGKDAESPGTCPEGTVLKGSDCLPADAAGDTSASGGGDDSPKKPAHKKKSDDDDAPKGDTSSSGSSGSSDTGGGGGGGYDKDAVEAQLKRATKQIKSNCGSATDDEGKATGPWGTVTANIVLGQKRARQGRDRARPLQRQARGHLRRARAAEDSVSRRTPGRATCRSAGTSRSPSRSEPRADTLGRVAYDYDLVVIGVGPAGEKGAAQAAYFGKRVACIERADEPGGAAVHTGTLPSKTLRETAIFLSGFRQRELYGLSVEMNSELAVPKLLSRKNAVRELEVARIKWNLERHNVPLLQGRRALRRPAHHRALGRRRRAAHASRARCSSWRPGRGRTTRRTSRSTTRTWTTRTPSSRLTACPRAMLVVGGGVIGCEYASMFAAMRVAGDARRRAPAAPVVPRHRDRRAPARRDAGARRHVPSRADDQDDRARPGRGHRHGARRRAGRSSAEKVLASSGRSGWTEGLGLEASASRSTSAATIKVDADYRTAAPNIYAAGDVIGFPALASTSMDQARVAVCHAFGFDYKRQVSELLPFGIYTIPEVSCIGLLGGEREGEGLRRRGRPGVLPGQRAGQDRGRQGRGHQAGGRPQAAARCSGCHCIGERASELVHVGQAVMLLGGTVDTFIDMVFNYPTLGEMFKYAAYDALGAMAKG